MSEFLQFRLDPLLVLYVVELISLVLVSSWDQQLLPNQVYPYRNEKWTFIIFFFFSNENHWLRNFLNTDMSLSHLVSSNFYTTQKSWISVLHRNFCLDFLVPCKKTLDIVLEKLLLYDKKVWWFLNFFWSIAKRKTTTNSWEG